MYDTSDFRKGLKVRIDGQPFVIVEHQFVKPGKGQAFTRTKLKNMISGSMLDRTYRSGEKLEKADLESRGTRGQPFPAFHRFGTYDRASSRKSYS